MTAVLEAAAVRLGWASLFSPMMAHIGAAGAEVRAGSARYSFGSLLRTLMRPAEATEIRYPPAVTVVAGTAPLS